MTTQDHLAALRVDVPPARDLWPAIAARLEPRGEAGATPGGPASAPPPQRRRAAAGGPRGQRPRRRRNAAYATAAALVLALAAAWPLLPLPDAPAPLGPAPEGQAIAADEAPLLRAADALAREYQGALRETRASAVAAGRAGPAAALDAELERSATEVRAALARDPDALHLFQRLQGIYAHRLALSLRPA